MTAASNQSPRYETTGDRIYLRFQRPASGKLSDMLAGRPCDPRAFRRVYPDRWCEFLHRNFRSPLHVAVFFDVDERTARHWWEGSTAPQAWAMAYAIASIPDADNFLTEAA